MKIGIITMFHESCNYGGILQAYALVNVLQKMNLDAEQIRYDASSVYPYSKRIKKTIVKVLSVLKRPKEYALYLKLHKRTMLVRQAAKKLVPHSNRIYAESNIDQCVSNYDKFITGSDQVWANQWPAYFLSFVHDNNKKIAYAISIGNRDLSAESDIFIIDYAKEYKSISVREEKTLQQFIKYLPELPVETVLDPTLLLERNDWENIVGNIPCKEKYLFCYFLGSDRRLRDLAIQYAKQRHLIIVTIPHMQQVIENNDIAFGECQLFDATPQDFLACVKYAETIFTDSFHASVFSYIFQKQFFVFNRNDYANMNSRVHTLVRLLGTEDHYIGSNENYELKYLLNLQEIPYLGQTEIFAEKKKDSYEYLKRNLGM